MDTHEERLSKQMVKIEAESAMAVPGRIKQLLAKAGCDHMIDQRPRCPAGQYMGTSGVLFHATSCMLGVPDAARGLTINIYLFTVTVAGATPPFWSESP